jgi:hypothetical protein
MLAEPSRAVVPRGPLLLSGNRGAQGNHDHDPWTNTTPRIRDARGFRFSTAAPPFHHPAPTDERGLDPLVSVWVCGAHGVGTKVSSDARLFALDDNEVSFDEDGPLQKRMRQLSGARPTVLDEAAAADKEATDKRVVEEAAMKWAAEERAAKEAAVKKAMEERAAKEAAVKAMAVEVTGAAGGSLAPGQAPPVAGAKRAATPSGSTPSTKRPYRGVWKPRFVQLSLPLFSLIFASFSYYYFAQVLPLRRGHRDGRGCHRSGCVIPRSKIAGTKPPYVCPVCFIHTYSKNMINRFHVQ